ncbi:MAG: ribosomal protein S18-alanine N-acetyltransferase [Erysipelotrichaceae bacterium]
MIRSMNLSDLDGVSKIELEAFSHPWSKEDFEVELQSNPYALYFVLVEEDIIKAYIGVWIIYERAQITTIAVNKDFRRQGLSKKLMEFLDNLCLKNGVEEISLEVRVSNEKAINLYQNFGFEKKGIRNDYYQDNHEDAYLMVKIVKGD